MVELLSATFFKKVFKSVDDLSSPSDPWTPTSSSPMLGWPARMSHHVQLGLVEKYQKLDRVTHTILPLLERLR